MEAFRIELNQGGVEEFLKSAAVVALLKGPADKVAKAAGDGFVTEYRVGAHRARASIRTNTVAAKLAEAEDRTLTKALDAGRG